MKNILFLMMVALAIAGCNKNEDEEPIGESTSPSLYTIEKIYEKTGCKPTDCENITKLKLFTDKQSTKYLYGAKTKDDVECFWLAQFNSDGTQNWEIINSGKKSSYAYNPQIIGNGNIIVANASYTDLIPDEVSPILVDSKSGKYKSIIIKENFIYSNLIVSDDFFICTVDEKELIANPNATIWYAQIDNEGEIMYQGGCMNIPSGKFIFTDENSFVDMTPKKITRKGIKCAEPSKWEYAIKLPEYTKCDMELSINGDDVNAIYKIISNGKEETIKYKIYYSTGKDHLEITNITLPKSQGVVVGEELDLKINITPEEANVNDIIWSSSDENVATVDANGKIKGISKGECIITATTDGGEANAKCNIRVTLPTEVNGIILPEDFKMLLTTTKKLTATVTPATAINKNILWSSTDESVVSVDQDGKLTSHTKGTVTITAKTEEGNYTANCVVTVVDITELVTLRFVEQSIVIINGYITGSLYSEITNNSEETITISAMEILNGYGDFYADASNLLPKTLVPGESFRLGSGRFEYLFYPLFIWYIEFNNKTYSVYHQYGRSNYSLKKRESISGNSRIKLEIK